MRALIWSAVFGMMGIFTGCVSPGLESRLHAIETRQDSILILLQSMKEKSDFVASRVGWRPPADTAPKVIPVGESFFRGSENAKVTLVEFSDLQCPYCNLLAPTLDTLTRAYPGDVKLVFKHFPLGMHPQARAAAAAAIAAGRQGKFFEFRFRASPHFRNLSDSLYLAIAKELNLDMAQFKKEMALTPEVNRILEADLELGRQVGVEGTPTLFVNGRLATDRSFSYLAGLVERAK